MKSSLNLTEYAASILHGTTYEEKLIGYGEPIEFSDSLSAVSQLPSTPGRPQGFQVGQKSPPSLRSLENAISRAELLHFFANHELLALETMALALLKFPDAPTEFRLGLANTMREEQEHFALYTKELNQLGYEFGDFHSNMYFWEMLQDIERPMDYVVRLSMTFEQANLDYALFYSKLFRKAGHEGLGNLLYQVYEDEIGHVRHGVEWFNRWRDSSVSDWEAYLGALPTNMKPEQAVGNEFNSCGRSATGLSDDFISKLSLRSRKVGKTPVVWSFGGALPEGGHEAGCSSGVKQDLEYLALLFAHPGDVVAVSEEGDEAFLKQQKELLRDLPQIITRDDKTAWERVVARKVAGLEVWGWDEPTRSRLRMLKPAESKRGEWLSNVIQSKGSPEFFTYDSKATFASWIGTQDWSEVGEVLNVVSSEIVSGSCDLRNMLQEKLLRGRFVLKSPHGFSGLGNRRVFYERDIDERLLRWGSKVIAEQGAILIEPYRNIVDEFSLVGVVRGGRCEELSLTHFLTDERGVYRGTYVSPPFHAVSENERRFLFSNDNEANMSPIDQWREVVYRVVDRLIEIDYDGPFGVDGYLYRDLENGLLKLHALSELNLRWTFGHVATKLKGHVAKGSIAKLVIHPARFVPECTPVVYDEQRKVLKGDVLLAPKSLTKRIVPVLEVQDAGNLP